MTTNNLRGDEARAEIENVVLDAVQKGFYKVSDLISYCGPKLIDVNVEDVQRELDVPQIMRAIERLIRAGYLERENERTADQLHVRLTERGREAAPPMSAVERELADEHSIPPTGIWLLEAIVDIERREGSLPAIGAVRSEIDEELVTYQVTPVYNLLVESGLAREKGLFRYRIAPTDEGRAAVENYADGL